MPETPLSRRRLHALICDRNHEPKGRLSHYDLEGEFIEEVVTGLGMRGSADPDFRDTRSGSLGSTSSG
jgi:hypothetical protein